jgi:hypothetical protein
MPVADFAALLGSMLGQPIKHAVPDEIIAAAPPTDWSAFPDWNDFTDDELADLTGLLTLELDDEIVVATDVSFPSRGAFVMPADRLRAFVSDHAAAFGEPFFSGDVILACPSLRVIWTFHHEGGYALIEIS